MCVPMYLQAPDLPEEQIEVQEQQQHVGACCVPGAMTDALPVAPP